MTRNEKKTAIENMAERFMSISDLEGKSMAIMVMSAYAEGKERSCNRLESAVQRRSFCSSISNRLLHHSRVITRDWTENSIPTDNRRAGNGQESTSQKRGNT